MNKKIVVINGSYRREGVTLQAAAAAETMHSAPAARKNQSRGSMAG
jgi:hypothetical protein